MTTGYSPDASLQQFCTRLTAAIAARPLVAALALVVSLTGARLVGTVDSDVAWQLWIGQRILAGANLYHDIVETNPPLWFWMSLPVDRMAAVLHARVDAVLVFTVGAAVALSLFATSQLIRHFDWRRQLLLLAYGALALAAMPWVHVGQREHLALIGAFPYAALVASRREGRHVSVRLAALTGLGAALGFALKHYFLIVPALLELWLMMALGKQWRPARPETIVLAATGAAYAGAVVLLEPDFLTNIVPLLRLAYGAFGAPSFWYLFGPFAIMGLTLLFFMLAQARLLARRKAPLASTLLVAAIAFALAYFIQFKGWSYHAIPLIGCASLALAALLAETAIWTPSLKIFAPALLALPLALASEEQMHPALPSPDVLNAIAGLNEGDAVGFLTTETAIPWSVTLQRQYRYASRYNGFWMMPAVVANERLGNPNVRLTKLGQRVVSETTQDFLCIPPKRIIVFRPQAGDASFDILPFFLRDRQFANLLSKYHVRSRTSLETYEMVSPLGPVAGLCRHGV